MILIKNEIAKLIGYVEKGDIDKEMLLNMLLKLESIAQETRKEYLQTAEQIKNLLYKF